MSRQFFLQPEVKFDILEAARSLDNYHSGSGQRFLDLVQKHLDLIEANPMLFGFVLEELRGVTIHKYSYVIVYRVLGERTEVLAVVHGSRDPSSWADRQ